MNALIAITVLGVLCLFFEIFDLRKVIIPFSVAGLVAILGLTLFSADFYPMKSYYGNMVANDHFSQGFTALFLVLTIFLVTMSHPFYRNAQARISDFVAIKIFLLAGAVAMVTFGNLAMFFLGIEILSISLYVLAASNRLNLRSNEAGMKYFLMGSFASGIILFGICMIYGGMGTFDVTEIAELSRSAELPIWFPIGIILLTIGMLFKVAAVPFHFWAPDVYEGSPALTTATMSTLAKVTAMAALYKLLCAMNADLDNAFIAVVIVVSVVTMLVGNIMALRQSNVKRMLAFSGISHAGYMLMALLSLNNSGAALLYYAWAYALAGIAAFAVILYVCRDKEHEDIELFHGLGKTNPVLAAVLTCALISMAGIPVFPGFFAKLGLFSLTIRSGYLYVVIFAVISSIISVGYYFKLILAMYTKEPNEEKATTRGIYYTAAIVAIVINILLGLFPGAVTHMIP